MIAKPRIPELDPWIDQYLREKKPTTAQEVEKMLRGLVAETLEKMLKAELAAKLGYSKGVPGPKKTKNRRNGTTKKSPNK